MRDLPDLKRLLLLINAASLLIVVAAFVVLAWAGMMSEGIAGFLGLLAGTFANNLKESNSWAFGSSQSSQVKDKTISDIATSDLPPPKEKPDAIPDEKPSTATSPAAPAR